MSTPQACQKHASGSAFNAFAKVTSPFIGGALDYKQQTEETSIKKGTRLQQTMKYMVPIGSWRLRPGIEVFVDDSDKENLGANHFIVDADLDKAFRSLLSIEVKPCNLPTFREQIQKKFLAWGEVVATEVAFGMAIYSSSTMTCQSSEQLQAAKKALQCGLSGQYKFVKAEAGVGVSELTCEEAASQCKNELSEWQVISGVAATEPQAMEQHRSDINAWRCIHYKSFCPIIDFLKSDIRARIAEWHKLQPVPVPLEPDPIPAVFGLDRKDVKIVKRCGKDVGRQLAVPGKARDGYSFWTTADDCHNSRSTWTMMCADEAKRLYKFRTVGGDGTGHLLSCHGSKRDDLSRWAIVHMADDERALWELFHCGGGVFKFKRPAHTQDHPRFLAAHGFHARRNNDSSWALVHSWDSEDSLWEIQVQSWKPTSLKVMGIGSRLVRIIKHEGYGTGKFLACHHDRRDNCSYWVVAHDVNDNRARWCMRCIDESKGIYTLSQDGLFLTAHNNRRDGESL